MPRKSTLGRVSAYQLATGWAAGTLIAASMMASAPVALAQENFDPESVLRGMVAYRDKSLCAFCHGWNGEGANVVSQPPAPALTTTPLDRETLKETVRCGRPDTLMPRHGRNAWRDNDPCYGMTRADLEIIPNAPYKSGGWLRDAEIEDLLNFIQAELQGHTVGLEYCNRYYGETSRQCEAFRN